jgi:hypothetical protein
MAERSNAEHPLPDDFSRLTVCAICGKAIEKARGDVIVTALQHAVHAECAARPAP